VNGVANKIAVGGNAFDTAPDFDPIDRRELALVAVDRTRMPMVVTDPRKHDNPIVLANRAFFELTGYSAEEVIGRNCRFLQGPETSSEDLMLLREALAKPEQYADVELLNYRKDGTTFWNQLCISPVHHENGEILYNLGSQKDVSVKRQAEELEVTKRRLLMEVDHRTMNALALVKGIVSLSRANTVSELSCSINSRIDAIAEAHRLLSESGWKGAQLFQVFDGQVSVQHRSQIQILDWDIWVPAHVVQPLSMVFHELICNAVTHGALLNGDGRITLSCERNHGGLTLRWDERGSALQSTKIKEGFGLEIVRNVVERQLHGQMAIDVRMGALNACFNFPLEFYASK
jgi:PAS domain S-box-containing protein